jgi:hypothetical protein
MAMAKYRVLSLDGGGSWALIETMALMAMFGPDASGWDVLRHFDLAAANSGGSIVLGCLVANFTLRQTYQFFADEGKRRSLFSPSSSMLERALAATLGIGPKYSADEKLKGLRAVLGTTGDKTLTDAIHGCLGQRGTGEDVRLLIVGFDYDRCRGVFFRSAATKGPAYGEGEVAKITLAEAIHASSNAPVEFFDGPAVTSCGRFWDGGITGNNNPVLAGVTEAVTATKEFVEIVALSLGTGSVALPAASSGHEGSPFVRGKSETGLTADLRKLAASILDDPPDMASFIAHVMTGGGWNLPAGSLSDSQIVRMNPLVSPRWDAAANQWTAPEGMTAEEFTALTKMGMDALDQKDVQKVDHLADLWLQGLVRNQPIRMDRDTLKCELGQQSFVEAFDAWKSVSGMSSATLQPVPPFPG